MRVKVVPIVSDKAWHGSHELARFSTIYSGQAVLTLFGRRFNLGEPYVVVEIIHRWRSQPSLQDATEVPGGVPEA